MEKRSLTGLSVYWRHGTLDEWVPVDRARKDVVRLRTAGADVTYCEADIGHKIGPEALPGLEGWLSLLALSSRDEGAQAGRPPSEAVS